MVPLRYINILFGLYIFNIYTHRVLKLGAVDCRMGMGFPPSDGMEDELHDLRAPNFTGLGEVRDLKVRYLRANALVVFGMSVLVKFSPVHPTAPARRTASEADPIYIYIYVRI